MIWLFALACLGVVGMTGRSQGPIRAGFSLIGLLFGAAVSTPLSPLTRKLLPVLGLKHPGWNLFLPRVLAFVLVVIVFKIIGNIAHRKVVHYFKYEAYKTDERRFNSWERLYTSLGFCLGLVNGTVYFFLLMMPLYIGGYFATEVSAGQNDPAGVKFLTRTRAALHDSNLDRVLSAFDPMPAQVYLAGDIVSLVLRNPDVKPRLAHYPVFLTLGQRKEFQNLATDTQLQDMIQNQAKISDILASPTVQAIVTNAEITGEISQLLANDLPDLQEYLNTGTSPKFGAEPILGIWTIDLRGTIAQERKLNPDIKSSELNRLNFTLRPVIEGLSLTVTMDNQIYLNKTSSDGTEQHLVSSGTWKKESDVYQVSLKDNSPDSTPITIEDGTKLYLPRAGHVMVFNKVQ